MIASLIMAVALSAGGGSTVQDSMLFDLAPGFELSGRLRLDRLSELPIVIASKGDDATRGAFLLRVDRRSEGGRLSFFANYDGSMEPRVSSAKPVVANVWYDFRAAIDGDFITLTVNGEKSKIRRTGSRIGCGDPLVIGKINGELRDLAFDGTVPPESEKTDLVPNLRLFCRVTFDERPKVGETTILSKSKQYLLRYDRKSDDQPGAFSFFVCLNGGWEPHSRVVKEIEPGHAYSISAGWDGRNTYLGVDNDCDKKGGRSGTVEPCSRPIAVGRFRGRVEDLRTYVQKCPGVAIGEFRTKNMLPRVGEKVAYRAELSNIGDAVSNFVVTIRVPEGVSTEPKSIRVPSLATGCKYVLNWTIDTGGRKSVLMHFTASSPADGRLFRTARSINLMPAKDPDLSAKSWQPPLKPSVTHYVDSRCGDDAMDGLSPTTAWRTLSRASGLALGPGERMLLRRGSVFSDELKVTARAVVTNWAEIAAYGEGARPVIRRHRRLDERCAYIAKPECLAVRDLVVCNAAQGLVVDQAKGGRNLLIEHCLAHHIEGIYRSNAHGIPEWDGQVPATPTFGGGLVANCAKHLVFRDCEMYMCSSGFRVSGTDLYLGRLIVHGSTCHNTSPHPYLTSTCRAWLVDSVFDRSGWNASAGTMGIMLAWNNALVIRGCHFLNHSDSGSHDEGGIDFEAGGENCLIDECTFRNNAGAAIEVLGLRSPQVRNCWVRNCRFDRNNVAHKLGPSEIYVWGGRPATDREVCCSNGRIESNGYVLNDGILFYTNMAVSTRGDWELSGNRAFASSAELDRAMPLGDPPRVSAGDEIWTDSTLVALAGSGSAALEWQPFEGPGDVRFDDATQWRTTARFSECGDYRLLLKSDDGRYWNSSRTAVHVLPAGTIVARAWTFAKDHDAEGWTAENLNVQRREILAPNPVWNSFSLPVDLCCGDYYVMAMRDTKTAAIVSPEIGIESSTADRFVIRLHNRTASRKMRLSWTTREEPTWDRARSVVFGVKGDADEDETYEVPLSSRGTLARLKLEFSADGEPLTGTVRVDYIWVGRTKRNE